MNGQFNSDDRFRNFEFMIYPDSAVEGWREYLSELHIPIFISPLHDKDLWTVNDEKKNPLHKKGTPKKAHYHIMVMFQGKKSPNQVYRLCVEPIGGVYTPDNDFNEPIANPVHSLKGFARYLCHLDNPDKTAYSPKDVSCLGGADYAFTCQLPQDTFNDLIEIIDFINTNQVYSYANMVSYFRNSKSEYLSCAIKNVYFLTKFIESCWWTHNNNDSINP